MAKKAKDGAFEEMPLEGGEGTRRNLNDPDTKAKVHGLFEHWKELREDLKGPQAEIRAIFKHMEELGFNKKAAKAAFSKLVMDEGSRTGELDDEHAILALLGGLPLAPEGDG